MSSPKPATAQLLTFMSDFIEKCKNYMVEKENILEYDAIELTLMLKSIGYRLVSLEFNGSGSPNNEGPNEIEIDIKCKRSGLHSKMQFLPTKCTCPSRKSENNNSFWEIQGIAPDTVATQTKGLIQDSSCNLLPEISKKTQHLARTMLTVLLPQLKVDLMEEFKEKPILMKREFYGFQDTMNPLSRFSDDFNSFSPKDRILWDRQEDQWLTPLSSINVTPINIGSDTMRMTTPKIILSNCIDESIPESNSEKHSSVMSLNNEIFEPNQEKNISAECSPDAQREICIIENLTHARKQLDAALLMLKFRIGPALVKSTKAPSAHILTPQNINKKIPSTSVNRKSPNSSIASSSKIKIPAPDILTKRRHSFGPPIRNEATNKSTTLRPSPMPETIKRKSFGNPTVVTSKFRKPDAPYSTKAINKKPSDDDKSLDKKKSNLTNKIVVKKANKI